MHFGLFPIFCCISLVSLFDQITDAELRYLTASAEQWRSQQHLFRTGLGFPWGLNLNAHFTSILYWIFVKTLDSRALIPKKVRTLRGRAQGATFKNKFTNHFQVKFGDGKKANSNIFLMGIYFILCLPKCTEKHFVSPYKLQNQEGTLIAQNATRFDYHPNQ